MSVLSFLGKIFGNKSQRDLKEIQPIIDKINAIGPTLKDLTNDLLRAKIEDVRADLAAATKEHQDIIDQRKAQIDDLPFDQRQPLWDEIDEHEKKILDILEDKLNEHLPIVFATMRETAARFAANETNLTAVWPARARNLCRSTATKPSGKINGWPAATKSPGIWCITTCSSSAA